MGKKRRKKRAEGRQAPRGGDQPEVPADEPVDERVPAPADQAADAPEPPLGSEAGEQVPPADPKAPSARPGRRDFLAFSGNLLVGVCGLGAVAGGLRMGLPDFETGPPERLALGLPADFKMHTLTWMREQDVFVLHDSDGYGAFSARCTHLGCTVRRTSTGFACPCHGAAFDPLGRVVTGPARDDLPWYAIWRATDGRLWIDTRVQVSAGPRPLERLDRASVFGD